MLFFLGMMQPHVQVFSRLKSDLTRKESKTASKTFVAATAHTWPLACPGVTPHQNPPCRQSCGRSYNSFKNHKKSMWQELLAPF